MGEVVNIKKGGRPPGVRNDELGHALECINEIKWAMCSLKEDVVRLLAINHCLIKYFTWREDGTEAAKKSDRDFLASLPKPKTPVSVSRVYKSGRRQK